MTIKNELKKLAVAAAVGTLLITTEAMARGRGGGNMSSGGATLFLLVIIGGGLFLRYGDAWDRWKQRRIKPSERCAKCNKWSASKIASKQQIGFLCPRCKEPTYF